MTVMNRLERAVRGRWGRSATSLFVLAGLVVVGPAHPASAQGPWDVQPVQSTYIAPVSFRVDLLSLNRPSPQAVVATFRITNVGSTDQHPGLALGTTDDVASAAGFALVDADGMKAYFPLTAQDGRCVCSLFDEGTGAFQNVGAGQTLDIFVWFPAPPADLQRVSVMVPRAPPLLDVPIGSSTAPVPVPEGQVPRDPTKLSLRPPRIQQLVSVIDDLDKTKTVEEDDEEKRVRLSADVLFKINKANLTPQAQDVLRDVAEQIETSDAKVVHVDGHTDTTGNDAINDPLSKRRARSVRDALEKKVDRDVRFAAEGHGSRQPVAPNDTEEGRRLNRRVTVTFAK